VWTSDVKGSGTDANVFINLVGEGGETGEHALAADYDTFERAQVARGWGGDETEQGLDLSFSKTSL